MKQWLSSLLFVALAVSICVGQESGSAALPGQASPAAASQVHGVFEIELAKPLDSKKLKPGTEVDAKVLTDVHLSDGMTIRRGSRVIGHITEAKARSKGDAESALGIVFDKIRRPDGVDTPITSVIQAVAPNPNPEAGGASGMPYYRSEDIYKPTVHAPPPASVPLLDQHSKGVLGIKNLQLGPDGVLISNGKEVKLDNGTRIELAVTL